MTPLAVTGVGVVSPVGVGRAAFTASMRAAFAQSASEGGGGAPVGGKVLEVPAFDATKYLGDKGLRSLDRLTKLLIVASRLALEDAGLKRDGAWSGGHPDHVGMVVSNAYGSLEAITELDRVATLEDARYINPSRFPLTVSNSAAGYASIWEDLRAINVSVSDGNCGGLDAVGCAAVFFEQGRADALLVGGAEAMSEALALGFDRLGALSGRARIGEGSAIAVLEPPRLARGRGREPLCTIVGYGTAFVGPDRPASLLHATPDALERAIASALRDGRASPDEVDVVVSGISGFAAFDEAERRAIDRAVGEDACVVAPKVAFGETLGAAGALGMLAALVLLAGEPDASAQGSAQAPAGGVAAPAAASRSPSLLVRGALRGQPRTALVTSMGYYGNASALVMRARTR